MRIAILAYNLIGAGGLSVGKNVVSMLPQVGPDHSYLMIVPKGVGYDLHEQRDNVEVVEIERMGYAKRLWFETFKVAGIVRRYEPDLIWGLGNIGLVDPPCRQAILFHQSQLLYEAKHFGRMPILTYIRILWFVKRRLRRCLKSTDVVFCQTPITQERFARTFKYPIEQIHIMPNAVSEFTKIERVDAGVPDILKDKNGYFNLFYLTHYYSHKNIEVLIDVFRDYSDSLKNVRCIITVDPDGRTLMSDIRRYHLEDRIVNVGPLDQGELAGYFYNCDALLFPTLLESFSAAYLEAMHFGLPILTSDLDFARYVCEDAAMYFDPWSPGDIVDKVLKLKGDLGLQKSLSRKGSERICTFYCDWRHIVMDALGHLEQMKPST